MRVGVPVHGAWLVVIYAAPGTATRQRTLAVGVVVLDPNDAVGRIDVECKVVQHSGIPRGMIEIWIVLIARPRGDLGARHERARIRDHAGNQRGDVTRV